MTLIHSLLPSAVGISEGPLSRPESFNKLFMCLEGMNFSLLTLLNIGLHCRAFLFANI